MAYEDNLRTTFHDRDMDWKEARKLVLDSNNRRSLCKPLTVKVEDEASKSITNINSLNKSGVIIQNGYKQIILLYGSH